MPFRSQAQQRFAFATDQPWAKRWARETDFAKLPKRIRKKLKDAGATAGPPVAGPGGLLGTPGLGGRKWGNRSKDKACICGIVTKESLGPGITRIRGNLCNVHGRYGRCPGAPAKTTPKKGKQPRQTPAQRTQDNAALRRDRRDQVLADMGIDPGASEALVMLRNGEQPDPAALARMGAVEAGLVEQAADGSYRMTPSGRALIAAAEAGDPGRAGDIISATRDRKAARTARERAAAQKKLDAAAKRAEAAAAKKKPAGGGGSSGGDSSSSREAERQATRQQREQERQEDRKRREEERQADRAKREAERQEDRATRLRERAEDRAAMLEERRARRGSAPVARSRTPIQMPSRRRRNAVRAKSALEYNTRFPGETAWDAMVNDNSLDIEEEQELLELLSSFTVFKDHTGAHRWLARSTTAYRDRDREILPIAALDVDSQRMTASRQFGPLRWWHLGKPDPFNAAEPWGIGLDLGDCDFSTQIGTTRVESGTFRDPAVAVRIAATADQYELSPGFFHAYGEAGPPDGIYQQVRTFERSLVPTRYGRASNLFTGLTVKEHRMDPQEMERRFKAAIEQLGLSREQAQQLATGLVQTDKSAAMQGVTYKSDDAPAVFTAPDGTQGLIVDGRFVALKAAAPAVTEKADMPPEEMIEAGETEAADGEAEAEAEYVGDMAPAAFRALLIDAFSEAITQFGAGISGKMTEMDDALKAMGYARMKSEQDASAQAAEVAQLKARLAQLIGDQPAVVAPADIEAALKGAPEAPSDAAQIPADATPVQRLAMQTMPALYQNNPNGGFQGWVPPTPQS